MGSAASSSSLKAAAASATDSCHQSVEFGPDFLPGTCPCSLVAALGTKDQELAAALSQLDTADLKKLKSAVAGGQRVVVDP